MDKISVDIWKLRYFRERKNLDRLNQHIAIHSDFTIHQLCSATGCTRASSVLVLQYAVLAGALRESLAYHDWQGCLICSGDTLPDLPIEYEDNNGNERTIETIDQLIWEPIFIVTEQAKNAGWHFFNSQ